MKRYAITLALVLLIAASLGVYYAYGAGRLLPEYRLQTLEGDPAEASGVTLFGSYVGGKGSFALDVTAEGSRSSNRSLWQQWQKKGESFANAVFSDIDALYREHPEYMRGKHDTAGFYQDEEWIIYVRSDAVRPSGTIRWKFDALDLASDKRIRYSAEQSDSATYADVIDVQRIGGEVHALTFIGQKGGASEYRDEVFEASTGKPIRSAKLPLGEPSAPDREAEVSAITEAVPTAPNPRAMFIVSEHAPTAKAGSDTNVPTADAVPSDQIPPALSKRVYEYDYASGAIKEVPIDAGADEYSTDAWTDRTLEGDAFTVMHATQEAAAVERFDLAAGRAEPQLTIPADRIGQGRIGQVRIANGRVYLLLQTGDKSWGTGSMPIVVAADAKDGRILYEGQPVCVDPNGRPQEQLDDVWLLNLSVRR